MSINSLFFILSSTLFFHDDTDSNVLSSFSNPNLDNVSDANSTSTFPELSKLLDFSKLTQLETFLSFSLRTDNKK